MCGFEDLLKGETVHVLLDLKTYFGACSGFELFEDKTIL